MKKYYLENKSPQSLQELYTYVSCLLFCKRFDTNNFSVVYLWYSREILCRSVTFLYTFPKEITCLHLTSFDLTFIQEGYTKILYAIINCLHSVISTTKEI